MRNLKKKLCNPSLLRTEWKTAGIKGEKQSHNARGFAGKKQQPQKEGKRGDFHTMFSERARQVRI